MHFSTISLKKDAWHSDKYIINPLENMLIYNKSKEWYIKHKQALL